MPTDVAAGPTSTVLSRQLLWPGGAPPASTAQGKQIELTFADHLMMPYYRVQCLFFYPAPAGAAAAGSDAVAQSFMPVDRLSRAFQRVLDAYPLLAGQLVRRASDGAVLIEHGGARDCGVEFLSAATEASMDDMPLSAERYTGMAALPPTLELLQPMDFGPDGKQLPRPLCSVQHTRFACGGVCLGLYMQHYLVDGEAYFSFIKDWRDTYAIMMQQENEAAQAAAASAASAAVPSAASAAPSWPSLPCLDRSVLLSRLPEAEQRALAAEFKEDVFTTTAHKAARLAAQQQQEKQKDSAAAAAASPSASDEEKGIATPAKAENENPFCVHRVLRFDKSELAGMVRAASSGPGCSVPWVSTFEAMATHMLRCMSRARLVSREEGSVAEGDVVVNFRAKHLGSALPPKLFVNAVTKHKFSISGASVWHEDKEEGVDRALAEAASACHKAVLGVDGAFVERVKSWVEVQERKDQFTLVDDHGITLVSWAKFGLYGAPLTFEPNAPPVRVCFPHSPQGIPGLVTILETPPETGGALDVYVGLERTEMERMLADPVLRRYRSEKPAPAVVPVAE